MAGAADTLFLPFTRGDISLPTGNERWLYLNAQPPIDGLDRAVMAQLDCEQGFRPDYTALKNRGFSVEAQALAGNYKGALILLGKHRGENEDMVHRASTMLPENASILIAGDKQSGIAPMRKRLSEVTEIRNSFAKYHATVIEVENRKAIADLFESSEQMLVDDRFKTAPGMFSHAHIDPASRLLADHMTPKRIKGDVADFGAGWGYLAAEVCAKGAPKTLALFEAHWPSLQAALENVRLPARDIPVEGIWADLVQEGPPRRFDAIVMNPPFHRGAATDSDIGKGFIRAASAALRPNGVLLVVANVKLPYEETLAASFRRVTELEKRDGFKLFEAVR